MQLHCRCVKKGNEKRGWKRVENSYIHRSILLSFFVSYFNILWSFFIRNVKIFLTSFLFVGAKKGLCVGVCVLEKKKVRWKEKILHHQTSRRCYIYIGRYVYIIRNCSRILKRKLFYFICISE